LEGKPVSSKVVDNASPTVSILEGPKRLRKRTVGDLAALVIPIVGFAVAPFIYSNQLFLVYLMAYVVLAQGINVSYGFTGYLPFGYFGFFGAGAYAFAIAVTHFHVDALLGLLIGGIGGLLVGAIFMPLFRLNGAYFAIATLAGAEALADLISNPSLVKITNGPYGENLASVYSSGQIYVAAVVVLALALLAVFAIRHSRFGLSLLAIREDQYSAQMVGINVVRDRSLAWLAAALLAGLAGAVFGWATTVFYPSAVLDPSISVFAIVFALFGGVGSIWGPTIGAVLLYGLYEVVGVSDPQFFQLIFGAIIILLILFVPGGLGSAARSLFGRVRSGADG
jgi:branched-chain amino acid transport system permease protein